MPFRRIGVALLLSVVTVCGQTERQIFKPAPSTGFLKHLTVESFGYTGFVRAEDGEFSPAVTSAFYNLHQLTCGLCISGPPVGRTRAVLPPFGAKATYGVWHDRLILFAGFGGIDAVPGFNTPRMSPILMRATPSNDDWIVSSEVGARIAVDPQKQVSLGVTESYVNDFGPAKNSWTRTAGDVTFTPGLFREVAQGVGRIHKRR